MTSHRTRLGLPARPGWLVREQVEAMAPDGSVHVVAFSEPVDDVTTSDFAAGYGQLLAEHLPGYEEVDVRQAQLFGGRAAVLRRYRHVPTDGAPLAQVAAYLVEGGIGHVVTATTTSSRFAAAEGDLLALLVQVDIDRSTVFERPAMTVPPTLRAARGEVSWQDAREAWESAPSAGSEALGSQELGTLTGDELTALAQIVGAERFPFVDEADVADAVGDAAGGVLRAARRSLVARGLAAPSPDGSLVLESDLRRAVELAVDPNLVVTLESEGDDPELMAFAVEPVHMVEVGHVGAGAYRVLAGRSGDLVMRIATLTRAAAASDRPPGDPVAVSSVAIDRARAFLRTGDHDGARHELASQPELLDALTDATSFNRVRAVHRSAGVVHGGELLWCQTRSGAVWVLDQAPTAGGAPATAHARPVGRGDLYAELLALLP